MKTKNIEEGREKEHSRQKHLLFSGVRLVVICFMLLFVGVGVVSATVTYDGTKIIISDGAENLTSINQTLNDPSFLEQLSSKEWLLKKPILIESTGILNITDTDCDWLKLQSLNDGNPAYIENLGVLDMRNTKVTSWNSTTNDVAPKTDSTRAYIYSHGTQLLADSCNLSSLGYDSPFKYGIHLYQDSAGAIIKNTTMINNYQGLSIDEDSVQVINCEIHSSGHYGVAVAQQVWPLTNLYFEKLIVHDNVRENFMCKYRPDTGSMTNSTLIDCESYNGYGNLFNLKSTRNLIIRNCKAHDSGFGSWHSCFDFHTRCDNITVESCEAWNCQNAFFIHNFDTNITIKNSIAHDADNGFMMMAGNINNRVENCTAYNVGTAFGAHSSSENEFVNCIAYNCAQGGYFKPYNWTGGIMTYTEAYFCYDNIYRDCNFSNNAASYKFEQSGQSGVDYGGTNYIYNQVEPLVTFIGSGNLTLLYKYENGKVFKVDGEWVPCYPDGSYKEWTIVSSTTISAYDLYAVPSSEHVDIIVNKFNTSLQQGEILVNFTANATNGNNVVFTIRGLRPNHYYLIKRDGIDFATKQANSSGYIQFSNSEWSARTFTIEESSIATGNISGTVTEKDTGTPTEGAIVTADGYSNITNSTGGYIITLQVGNYTVTATKNGYYPNSTTAQVLENQTTTVDFILTRHKRKLPVAKPVCATGIAILIVVAYWRYRRRRRRMRSGGLIVLVPGVIGELMRF